MMKGNTVLLLTLFSTLSCMAQEWNLDECLSYALRNNQELISHQYDMDIQKLNHKSAKGRLFPELNASAGLDYYWKVPMQTLPGELVGELQGTFIAVPTTTTYAGSYSLDMRMNIINPEVWSQIRLEAIKEQLQKQKYLSIERVLSRNVSISFYLVQQYECDIISAKRRLNNQTQIHEQVKNMFNNGILDQIAVNQSLSMLKEQQETYVHTCHALESSLVDLKFWMGYPVDSILAIQQENNIPILDITGFDVLRLPDFEFQRLKVDVAEKEFQKSLSAFYPKLEFIGSYGQLGFGNTNSFIAHSSAWYTSSFIGLRLSIPIFSLSNIRTSRKGKIRVIQTKQDFLNYEENQRKEYAQQINRLQSTLKILNIQKEKLHLAEENEKLSMQKIEKGIIDMLQLKQIQRDLIEEQNKYNQVKTNYLKHYVEFIYLQHR
jgi:Outer membrane protein